MGYSRRSYSSSTYHVKSVRSWSEYKKDLLKAEQEIANISYDPYTQANFTQKYDWDNEPAIKTHLFILPTDFHFREAKRLMDMPLLPDKPAVRNHPDLILDKSNYPAGYFGSEMALEHQVFFKAGAFVGKILNNDSETKPKNKTLYEKEIEEREEIVAQASLLKEKIEQKWKDFQRLQVNANEDIKRLSESFDPVSAEKLIRLANDKYELPTFLRKDYEVAVDGPNQVAIIQLEFPDYANEKLIVSYTGKYPYKPKLATEAGKKKLIKECLYSLMIRSAYLAAKYNYGNLYKNVVVNVEQNWFDPATGQPKNGIIASLQASVEYLVSLDLSKLDPEICFKYLKGISTPNLQNASPIRPIFTLNKQDNRLVANKDVDSVIEPEANLAAMEWEDFEHLVAQLFEWEFSKNGIEVKVTRASRDRGVDAILFDPDPLKGGKYVIQAKRYTRTVDVSAVRDLYGTVMNEGANRGILITTASYGPDAYEFANGKPLSLVDGPNLLLMLQRHGKKFKIDLEEARRLNAINQNNY